MVLFLIATGAYYITDKYPQSYIHFKQLIGSFSDHLISRESEISTLEVQYEHESISQFALKKIPSEKHTIGDGRLLYYPCLVTTVKHVSPEERQTEESSMVWDLLSGELFLSLSTFKETSGFQDCIKSQTNVDDFRILHLLAKEGGSLTKETLIRLSGLDDEIASSLIESLRKRHLVTISRDLVRLHVKNPFFTVAPYTAIPEPFVQKIVSRSSLISEKFSKKTIEDLIQNAYGKDIAILDSDYVWLPIWEITIQNPDGSTRKTFWNAISGKEFEGKVIQVLRLHPKTK